MPNQNKHLKAFRSFYLQRASNQLIRENEAFKANAKAMGVFVNDDINSRKEISLQSKQALEAIKKAKTEKEVNKARGQSGQLKKQALKNVGEKKQSKKNKNK